MTQKVESRVQRSEPRATENYPLHPEILSRIFEHLISRILKLLWTFLIFHFSLELEHLYYYPTPVPLLYVEYFEIDNLSH